MLQRNPALAQLPPCESFLGRVSVSYSRLLEPMSQQCSFPTCMMRLCPNVPECAPEEFTSAPQVDG